MYTKSIVIGISLVVTVVFSVFYVMSRTCTVTEYTYSFSYPCRADIVSYTAFVEADIYGLMREADVVIMPEKHTNFEINVDPYSPEDYKNYAFLIAPDVEVMEKASVTTTQIQYAELAHSLHPGAQIFHEGETAGYVYNINDTKPFPPAYIVTSRGVYTISLIGGGPYADPERKYRERTQNDELEKSAKKFKEYPRYMKMIIATFHVLPTEAE